MEQWGEQWLSEILGMFHFESRSTASVSARLAQLMCLCSHYLHPKEPTGLGTYKKNT